MLTVLAVLDVNSEGHVVRLSDGSTTTLLHTADVPSVGAELGSPPVSIPPSIDHLNSPEQVAANVLSEMVKRYDATTQQVIGRCIDENETLDCPRSADSSRLYD